MYPVFTEYGYLFVLLQEKERERDRKIFDRQNGTSGPTSQRALHVTDREQRKEGDCHRLANRQANDR